MERLNEHILYILTNGRVKKMLLETDVNPRQPKLRFFDIVVGKEDGTFDIGYGMVDLIKGKWVPTLWNTLPNLTKEQVIKHIERQAQKLQIKEYELYEETL